MATTTVNGITVNKITKSQYDAEVLAGNITSTMQQNEVFIFTDDQHVSASEKTSWNNKSNFSGSYNDLTNKPTIPTVPTDISAFTNDSGYLTTVPSTYVTETELNTAISGKANTSDLPTKVSDLNNDSNFATQNYVDGKVSSIYKYKGSVANQAALPNSGQVTGDVYNTNETGMNYAWNGSSWDALGSDIDLSNYVTTTSLNTTLNGYVENNDLATVATSGSYTDLTNKPEMFSGCYTDLTEKPSIPTSITKIWG